MLRRQSTKSRSGLHHRKSTSSARSICLEHIDPTTALRDAQKAATEAYARGQHRSTAKSEMPLFPPPSSASSAFVSEAGQLVGQFTQAGGNEVQPDKIEAPELARQQSVRFVRPFGCSKVTPLSTSALSRESAFTAGTGPSLSRILHLQENPPLVDHPPPRQGDYETLEYEARTETAYRSEAEGPNTSNRRCTATTSSHSFRTLRRSRSMFSPGEGFVLRQHGSEDRPSRYSKLNEMESNQTLPVAAPGPTPSLRAPKSTSVLKQALRGHSQVGSSASEAWSELTAANRGRSPSSATLESGRVLKPSPSLLFWTRGHRTTASQADYAQRPLRKSLRGGLGNGALPQSLSKGLLPGRRDSGFKDRARTASRTIKLKIKNFIGRLKKDSDTGEPEDRPGPDQRCMIFCEGYSPELSSSDESTPADLDDAEAAMEGHLSRAPSQTASVHTVAVDQMLRSYRGSLESLPSDRRASNETSRVTSWASSGLSTVASQQEAWSDWQRQRLSAIQENGVLCPRPSPGRSSQQIGGVPSSVALEPTVDSQRVFSALMKRLAETQQLTRIVSHQHQPNEEGLGRPGTVSRTNSERGSSFELETPQRLRMTGTIRCVAPSTEVTSSSPMSALSDGRGWRQTVIAGAPGAASARGPPPIPHGREHEANGEDSPSRGQPRSDRSSAFFGSPSRHLFRNPSPYRRVTRENMRTSGGTTTGLVEIHGEQQGGALAPDVEGAPCTYSESSYSCNDGTDESLPGDSELGGFEAPSDPKDHGSATVADSKARRHTENQIESRTTQLLQEGRHRATSSEGSIDWKNWLAANVSKLAPPDSPAHGDQHDWPSMAKRRVPVSKNTRYTNAAHGHMREAAQTYAEDDDEGVCEQSGVSAPTPAAKLTATLRQTAPPPLTVVEQNVARAASSHQRLDNPVSAHEDDRALAENKAPPRADSQAEQQQRHAGDGAFGHSPSPVTQPPPPIPTKSALRPSPSSPLLGLSLKAFPQTPDHHKSATGGRRGGGAVARTRSLSRIYTTDAGSPCQQQPATSVKLVRRGGILSPAAHGPSSNMTSPSQIADNGHADEADMPKDGARTVGSKKMVDLFLNSRRRRMTTSSEDSNAAFL